MMKAANQTKHFVPKCFFFSLLLSILLLLLVSLQSHPQRSLPNHPPPSSTNADIRIRPGYSSYDAYIQRQLNKTLNPKLRQIWTTRDWNRKINVFSSFFSDLREKHLLSNSSKALCVGARVGQEVEALRRIGVSDSVGIDLVPYPPLVIRGDFHNQPFQNGTFDFEFSNVFDHALYPDKFVGEIERTLKPGGICVLHVAISRRSDKYSANDLYNVRGLKALFRRSECLHVRKVDGFGLDTEVVFRKMKSKQRSRIKVYSKSHCLKVLKDGLSTLHAPYAYGFAIILLTVLVKAATFPLTKKQVESAMAMRSLQPQIKAIQQRYAGDQEKIQVETARLYKLAGINPLAGCLPTLATIPVWIGLYRALSNVADEGLLSEGFFWIPSLAGPTTIAARQNGSGISWLFPFIDGQPPLGWSDTLAYLVLPVLLVVSQYISVQIMQSSQSNDPNLKSSQAITKFLPLLIGYFALSVPSGLSLYWLTNNILSTAQQVWLQKLGGANNPVSQLSNDSITKEPSKIQKSKVETTTIKTTPKGGEKQTPEGPRPGDRFKQLKEQEARRRQQREEEKRKAIGAAGNNLQITNGELKKEAYLVEREDTKVELRNTNDVSTTGNSSNSEYSAVNGNYSPSESKEDQKISTHRMEDGEIASNSNNGRDHQHLYENVEKEEAVANLGSGENKLSGEDTKIRTEVSDCQN